jgi:hypothetical protein
MPTDPHIELQIAAFSERMAVSLRAAGEALRAMANQLARAFAVPMHLVAPAWERRVDRARRQRVATMMRRYRRHQARRARRQAVLRSAHA